MSSTRLQTCSPTRLKERQKRQKPEQLIPLTPPCLQRMSSLMPAGRSPKLSSATATNMPRVVRTSLKSCAPFNYRVSFQSSHNNIPGKHVALWMHANVRSPRLKKWRGEQLKPYRNDGWVAGGMVHLLNRRHVMIEWKLANDETRSAVVEDAIQFIRTEVFPYFHRFSDPSAVTLSFQNSA